MFVWGGMVTLTANRHLPQPRWVWLCSYAIVHADLVLFSSVKQQWGHPKRLIRRQRAISPAPCFKVTSLVTFAIVDQGLPQSWFESQAGQKALTFGTSLVVAFVGLEIQAHHGSLPSIGLGLGVICWTQNSVLTQAAPSPRSCSTNAPGARRAGRARGTGFVKCS